MSTRERILDAAAQILRTRGVVQATTKEIAQATGVSEPTLYKYFGDKERLLLAVLQERLPGPSRVDVRPGERDVAGNLTELAHATMDFYQRSIPMLGALLADPQRMAAHREAMNRHGAGPDRAVTGFAAYLRAEQGLGRDHDRRGPGRRRGTARRRVLPRGLPAPLHRGPHRRTRPPRARRSPRPGRPRTPPVTPGRAPSPTLRNPNVMLALFNGRPRGTAVAGQQPRALPTHRRPSAGQLCRKPGAAEPTARLPSAASRV